MVAETKVGGAGAKVGEMKKSALIEPGRKLLKRVTCPHCWQLSSPESLLWTSQHADLRGDPVLGADAQTRFLPSRFTVDGLAIDARGLACHHLACPRCHLPVAPTLLEHEPMFVSVIGVPASGKSYYITAMTWELRRHLPRRFKLSFGDADTTSNQILNRNEETLFLQADPDGFVAIEKTQTEGDIYDQIQLGQQVVSLPKPLLFTLTSSDPTRTTEAKVLCIYDNAGEHFRPGTESTASPVTQHLARARLLTFLYDPTKDPRFRQRLKGSSRDPQLEATEIVERQETILSEAAQRVRRYASLPPGRLYERPLVVVVPKADVWGHLLGEDLSTEPYVSIAGHPTEVVDLPRVERVSRAVRQLMTEVAPELVATAESFCSHVVWVPVSVFAAPPERRQGRREMFIRPRDVSPKWVTVPLMYSLAKWSTGLVLGLKGATKP